MYRSHSSNLHYYVQYHFLLSSLTFEININIQDMILTLIDLILTAATYSMDLHSDLQNNK